MSHHHLEKGGDLIWQIGRAYLGCRDENGNFDPVLFAEKSKHPNVKMIELKLSQGAKPGHGGILPTEKNTEEVAKIRHIKSFVKVSYPPYYTAFDTPLEMVKFIQELRALSGGKPVGFKLCIGYKSEFISVCQAMLELDIYPH